MGQLHTRKKRKTGERKEEKQSRIPDANSTCQLDFSRSRSSGGHLTTALIVKISRTKDFEGKAIMYFIPQGFISIMKVRFLFKTLWVLKLNQVEQGTKM